MVEHLAVERVPDDPAATRPLEFVERKGRGHPDSLCDGVAEAVSRRLCRYYRREFGRILHHNTDKVHLGAGRAEPAFGGGEVIEPLYVLVGGRATRRIDGRTVPVDDLAREAAREYLLATVPQLEPAHVEVETRIGATSTDLGTLFERGDRPLANDTSFGAGHAPLSPTERLVRTLEPRIADEIAAVGRDVKLMAARRDGRVDLVVAAAVLDRHVGDLDEYHAVCDRVRDLALDHADGLPGFEMGVSVTVNAADDPASESVYLTTTGLSAEMGDDGSVGRGNRVNGLITPHRPMSLEAPSGKNPVTHVGKIYNLVADRAAARVAEDCGGFAGLCLLSRIGMPVDEPMAVDAMVENADGAAVRAAVEAELADLDGLADAVVRGEIETF